MNKFDDQTIIRSRKKSKFSEVLEENLGVEENFELEKNSSNDCLGTDRVFNILEKEKTLEELEQIDEANLMNRLDDMNMSFKNKNKKNFLIAVSDLLSENTKTFNFLHKSKRSFSFDSIENISLNINLQEYGLDSFNSISSGLNFTNSINSSMSTNFSNYTIENILKQNLIVTDRIIKLIIVGDKAVGKTLFAKKLFNCNIDKNYEPTQSLEIKKGAVYINDTPILLELWDTNSNIVNSHLIKTYYKICNGFILICDVSNIDSIKFIEKQIENIINFSSNTYNIHLMANIKNDCNTDQYFFNLNYLSNLVENINIKVNYINLDEFSVERDIPLCKFINNTNLKNKRKKSNKRKSANQTNNISSNICEEKQKQQNDFVRDMSASPRTKKDKCSIF